MRGGSLDVYDCSCGDLHSVHFDARAGCDGSYVCVCPDWGILQLGGTSEEAPHNSRRLTLIDPNSLRR